MCVCVCVNELVIILKTFKGCYIMIANITWLSARVDCKWNGPRYGVERKPMMNARN